MGYTVAVVLSGSGVFDGSEINEVVLSLLTLEEANIDYQCFAPNIEQHHVINHLNNDVMEEKRNVLIEASRIVRGNIQDLLHCKAENFDGLLVPGGFGVAKNLSNLAFMGADVSVNEQFLSVCSCFKDAAKPVAYMCIAPALLTKIYDNVKCTIGNDKDTAKLIETMGGTHQVAGVNEIVVDEANKVVSTPAYMLANNLTELHDGIQKLIKQLKVML